MNWTRVFPLVASLALASSAWAQTAQSFPTKPVRFLVGSAPGGILEVVARGVGNKLHEKWGQPVVVEFRLGAAGSIAGDALAKSAPDGYTMLVAESGVWGISPHLVAKPPYDPRTDFAGVSQVGLLPVFLVIPSNVPANNLKEFIAYARQNSGKLSYASGGVGSIHQLSAELFKSMAKVDVTHVPYKGGGPAALAVMTGEVQMAFASYAGIAPGLQNGRLRMLGNSMAQRASTFPDIPTVAENGLPGFGIHTTLGIVAPAATPKDILAKVHADVLQALADPQVTKRISDAGLVVQPASGEQFGAVIREEFAKFGELVKLSGAKRGD